MVMSRPKRRWTASTCCMRRTLTRLSARQGLTRFPCCVSQGNAKQQYGVLTYRHLIIKTPCYITHPVIKHCLPKHEELSMTLRAGFPYVRWGFSMFDVCRLPLFQFYFIFQSHYLLFTIQLLSEQRAERTSVPLRLQLGFHEMEIIPFGESVSLLVRGNQVITCGAAVQQRVKRHSWIFTIAPFNRITCSLILFHQATEGPERSRYYQ